MIPRAQCEITVNIDTRHIPIANGSFAIDKPAVLKGKGGAVRIVGFPWIQKQNAAACQSGSSPGYWQGLVDEHLIFFYPNHIID